MTMTAWILAAIDEHPIVVGVAVPLIVGTVVGLARIVVGIIRLERTVPARLDRIEQRMDRADVRTEQIDTDVRTHMRSEDSHHAAEATERELRQEVLDGRLESIDRQLSEGAERMTRIEARLDLS